MAIAMLLLPAALASAADPCGNPAHYVPFDKRYVSALLFKVEKPGDPVSYVFGTVHLARPEIARAAENVFLTLAQVKAAGFEVADSQEQIEAAAAREIKLPPGPPHLLRQLGRVRYAKLRALLKGTDLGPKALEHLKPWAIAVALEFKGEEPGLPLDEKLRTAALKSGKPVFGLEMLKEQTVIFSRMPADLQLRMLKEAIDQYEKSDALKQALLKAYLAHDARAIYTLQEEEVTTSDDPALDEYLRDNLIIKRNRIMERRLLPWLGKESVVVSIGAMHLMGEQGILHLLEQDGYCITPIP